MTELTTVTETEPSDEDNISNAAPIDTAETSADLEANAIGDTEEKETPEEKAERKSKARKRIAQLTSEKYQYKNKFEELEKRFQEIELRNQPKEPVEPKLSNYDTEEEYVAAFKQFHVLKTEHDQSVKRQRETEQTRQIQRQNDLAKSAGTFQKKVAAEKSNYEGFDEAMGNPAFVTIVNQYSPEIVSLIQSSDNSTALAYELATNLDEAEIIANMSPIQAAHRVAKLESRLEKLKPKTISNAPAPIKPVGSSASLKDEWSKLAPGATFE